MSFFDDDSFLKDSLTEELKKLLEKLKEALEEPEKQLRKQFNKPEKQLRKMLEELEKHLLAIIMKEQLEEAKEPLRKKLEKPGKQLRKMLEEPENQQLLVMTIKEQLEEAKKPQRKELEESEKLPVKFIKESLEEPEKPLRKKLEKPGKQLIKKFEEPEKPLRKKLEDSEKQLLERQKKLLEDYQLSFLILSFVLPCPFFLLQFFKLIMKNFHCSYNQELAFLLILTSCTFSTVSATGAFIIMPTSKSTIEECTVSFDCAGIADNLVFTVNGLPADNENITSIGFEQSSFSENRRQLTAKNVSIKFSPFNIQCLLINLTGNVSVTQSDVAVFIIESTFNKPGNLSSKAINAALVNISWSEVPVAKGYNITVTINGTVANCINCADSTQDKYYVLDLTGVTDSSCDNIGITVSGYSTCNDDTIMGENATISEIYLKLDPEIQIPIELKINGGLGILTPNVSGICPGSIPTAASLTIDTLNFSTDFVMLTSKPLSATFNLSSILPLLQQIMHNATVKFRNDFFVFAIATFSFDSFGLVDEVIESSTNPILATPSLSPVISTGSSILSSRPLDGELTVSSAELSSVSSMTESTIPSTNNAFVVSTPVQIILVVVPGAIIIGVLVSVIIVRAIYIYVKKKNKKQNDRKQNEGERDEEHTQI